MNESTNSSVESIVSATADSADGAKKLYGSADSAGGGPSTKKYLYVLSRDVIN